MTEMVRSKFGTGGRPPAGPKQEGDRLTLEPSCREFAAQLDHSSALLFPEIEQLPEPAPVCAGFPEFEFTRTIHGDFNAPA